VGRGVFSSRCSCGAGYRRGRQLHVQSSGIAGKTFCWDYLPNVEAEAEGLGVACKKVWGDQEEHPKVRKACMDHMEASRAYFEDFIDDEDFDQ